MDIESTLNEIVSPFATAGLAVLIVLSLMEYLRPGSVSLFLDFRLLVAAVIVLWVVAALTATQIRRRFGAIALIAVSLAVSLPILYKMTVVYGRLGLMTFVCGVVVFVVIFVSGMEPMIHDS